jgi:hypothetical protein
MMLPLFWGCARERCAMLWVLFGSLQLLLLASSKVVCDLVTVIYCKETSLASSIRTTSLAIRYCCFGCTHPTSTSAMQCSENFRTVRVV